VALKKATTADKGNGFGDQKTGQKKHYQSGKKTKPRGENK